MKPTPLDTPDASTMEDVIFWTRERVLVEKTPPVPVKVGVEETGQFVIDDEDDHDESPVPEVTEEVEEWEDLPSLAERLLTALVDLAFVPGFTVPEESRTSDGAVAYVIWCVPLRFRFFCGLAMLTRLFWHRQGAWNRRPYHHTSADLPRSPLVAPRSPPPP